VIVCLLMTLMILMQRPKDEGLGAAFGGGVTDQVFGARTTNVLQRGTVYLGSLFFILSLILSILIGHQNKQKKLISDHNKPVAAKVPAPAPVKAKEVTAPKSLSDELPAEAKKSAETPNEAPADASMPAPKVTPPAETAPSTKVTPLMKAPATPAVSEAPKDK
jgi:preprotein translocase subunit SecG